MNRTEAFDEVREIIRLAQEGGKALPMEIRRRDRREPKNREKESLEQRLFAVLRKRFKRQAGALLERVKLYLPGRKADIPLDDWYEDDDDLTGELIRILLSGALGGVEIFLGEVRIGLDYTMVNQRAVKWAQKRAGELVREIDQTTLTAVREAVQMFVETPGFALKDLMGMLPFDERRARMVAVTETTRAYAMGQQAGAKELKKQYPGVRVVKTWHTNNDDLVCDVCGPLDGVEVEIEESFDGIDEPPAHPNCRCWIGTRTRIEE